MRWSEVTREALQARQRHEALFAVTFVCEGPGCHARKTVFTDREEHTPVERLMSLRTVGFCPGLCANGHLLGDPAEAHRIETADGLYLQPVHGR